jgi:hypothetical protein
VELGARAVNLTDDVSHASLKKECKKGHNTGP